MFYYRKEEIEKIERFYRMDESKAMAVYGRRRIGKTQLMVQCANHSLKGRMIYYQVSNPSYDVAVEDFKSAIALILGHDLVVQSLKTFKEIFSFLSRILDEQYVFVIDEFPILAKRTEDIDVEFQWIIDHALGKQKIILIGSQLSFMKKQIASKEAPLYGRFDEIIHLMPFSFEEVRGLFQSDEEAMSVYACTGGVAQYVMLFKRYDSVQEAMENLSFNKDGRLFTEANNLLMMELKEPTFYKRILEAIGSTAKTVSQIATKCGMDQRALTTYLAKLVGLDIIYPSESMLAGKRIARRYEISDLLFRFTNSFIEPNISYITIAGSASMKVILNERYQEYLGKVYEELVKRQVLMDGAKGMLPFAPVTAGRWHGNIFEKGNRLESEVDVIAYDQDNVIIGECKYSSKKIGLSVLEKLKQKAVFISAGKRKIYYLLASKEGFTEELLSRKDDNLILYHSLQLEGSAK